MTEEWGNNQTACWVGPTYFSINYINAFLGVETRCYLVRQILTASWAFSLLLITSSPPFIKKNSSHLYTISDTLFSRREPDLKEFTAIYSTNQSSIYFCLFSSFLSKPHDLVYLLSKFSCVLCYVSGSFPGITGAYTFHVHKNPLG